MDKPDSMTTREYLVRKVSQEQKIPLATVKTVIDEQFRSAHAALLDNNSLEISGFGKFVLNKRRVILRLASYKEALKKYETSLMVDDLSPEDEFRTKRKRDEMIKCIAHLTHKRNGFKD